MSFIRPKYAIYPKQVIRPKVLRTDHPSQIQTVGHPKQIVLPKNEQVAHPKYKQVTSPKHELLPVLLLQTGGCAHNIRVVITLINSPLKLILHVRLIEVLTCLIHFNLRSIGQFVQEPDKARLKLCANNDWLLA